MFFSVVSKLRKLCVDQTWPPTRARKSLTLNYFLKQFLTSAYVGANIGRRIVVTKTRAGRPTSACSNHNCLLEIEPGKLEVVTRDPNIKYCFACHKQPEKSSNFILHSLFGSAGSGQQDAAQAINVEFDQPFDEEDHSDNSVEAISDSDEKELSQEFDKDFDED